MGSDSLIGELHKGMPLPLVSPAVCRIGVVPLGTKELARFVRVGLGEVVKVSVFTGTKSNRFTHHHSSTVSLAIGPWPLNLRP